MNYRVQKKRERQINRVVFWTTLGICLVATMFYLQSRLWVVDLSHRYSDLNKNLQDLKRNNAALRVEVARLKAPERIEKIARQKLGLKASTDSSTAPHSSQRTIELVGEAR